MADPKPHVDHPHAAEPLPPPLDWNTLPRTGEGTMDQSRTALLYQIIRHVLYWPQPITAGADDSGENRNPSISDRMRSANAAFEEMMNLLKDEFQGMEVIVSSHIRSARSSKQQVAERQRRMAAAQASGEDPMDVSEEEAEDESEDEEYIGDLDQRVTRSHSRIQPMSQEEAMQGTSLSTTAVATDFQARVPQVGDALKKDLISFNEHFQDLRSLLNDMRKHEELSVVLNRVSRDGLRDPINHFIGHLFRVETFIALQQNLQTILNAQQRDKMLLPSESQVGEVIFRITATAHKILNSEGKGIQAEASAWHERISLFSALDQLRNDITNQSGKAFDVALAELQAHPPSGLTSIDQDALFRAGIRAGLRAQGFTQPHLNSAVTNILQQRSKAQPLFQLQQAIGSVGVVSLCNFTNAQKFLATMSRNGALDPLGAYIRARLPGYARMLDHLHWRVVVPILEGKSDKSASYDGSFLKADMDAMPTRTKGLVGAFEGLNDDPRCHDK